MAVVSLVVKALISLTYLTSSVAARDPILTELHIKIKRDADPNSIKISNYNVESVEPLFTLSETRLKQLTAVKPDLPDLTLWHKVSVDMSSSSQEAEDIVEAEAKLEAELYSLDEVLSVDVPKAYPAPYLRTDDVKRRALTPELISNQGYLGANTNSNNGIDAEKSWTFPGGNGEGITIYDVEYNWSQTHEDLGPANDITMLLNPGDSNNSPFSNGHGTAVLGEMIGQMNGLGVKGISYGASVGLAPEYTTLLGSARANAIMLAVDDGKAGDVILLEMQRPACGPDYGPAEESQSVFDATVVAVANGITVVAAAGNGNVNLDSPACNNRYNRNARDSGAIIVGAGGSGLHSWSPARKKLSYSTYGSRVDVQGWGYNVWTTGYGSGYTDPDDPNDENNWYTNSFSGTSSASPFVAASVANIQGIAIKQFGSPLTPLQVRTLLKDTGLPQLGGGGNIGPLVNLGLAIDSLLDTEFTPAPTTASPTRSPTGSPTKFPTLGDGFVRISAFEAKQKKRKDDKLKTKLKFAVKSENGEKAYGAVLNTYAFATGTELDIVERDTCTTNSKGRCIVKLKAYDPIDYPILNVTVVSVDSQLGQYNPDDNTKLDGCPVFSSSCPEYTITYDE